MNLKKLCYYAVISAFGALMMSCSDHNENQVIAEVGSSQLEFGELLKRLPLNEDDSTSRKEIANAISVWVNEEILYQEALKQGLDEDKETAFLVEQAKRKIFTDRLVLNIKSKTKTPEEGEILEYYQSHLDQFSRGYPVYRVNYIKANSLKQARSWLKKINKGQDFNRFKRNISKWVKQENTNVDYISLSEVKSCFQKYISDYKLKKAYGPKKCDGKYQIIQVQAIYPSDAPLPLNEAREDVILQFKKEKVQGKLDSLKNYLKSQTAVFTYLNKLPLKLGNQKDQSVRVNSIKLIDEDKASSSSMVIKKTDISNLNKTSLKASNERKAKSSEKKTSSPSVNKNTLQKTTDTSKTIRPKVIENTGAHSSAIKKLILDKPKAEVDDVEEITTETDAQTGEQE